MSLSRELQISQACKNRIARCTVSCERDHEHVLGRIKRVTFCDDHHLRGWLFACATLCVRQRETASRTYAVKARNDRFCLSDAGCSNSLTDRVYVNYPLDWHSSVITTEQELRCSSRGLLFAMRHVEMPICDQ